MRTVGSDKSATDGIETAPRLVKGTGEVPNSSHCLYTSDLNNLLSTLEIISVVKELPLGNPVEQPLAD